MVGRWADSRDGKLVEQRAASSAALTVERKVLQWAGTTGAHWADSTVASTARKLAVRKGASTVALSAEHWDVHWAVRRAGWSGAQ